MAVIRETSSSRLDPKVLAAIMACVSAVLADEASFIENGENGARGERLERGNTFVVRHVAQDGQSVWRWTGRRESMRGGWPW